MPTTAVVGWAGMGRFGRVGEGLVEHHARPAWVGEDGIDPNFLEGVDQQVTTHPGRLQPRLGRLGLGGRRLRLGDSFGFAHGSMNKAQKRVEFRGKSKKRWLNPTFSNYLSIYLPNTYLY